MNDLEVFMKWQESPLSFVCDIFNLRPQRVKPEYQKLYDEAVARRDYQDFKPGWFFDFVKGEEITWQQVAILLAVGDSITKKAPPRISVRSGHGVGKSATIAWLILWFLFCFKHAQIPCTAPTSDQLNDILWKEVQVWLTKMPQEMRDLYDWSNDYIRMVESPKTWFARARTARKESPEALAGIHSDYVLYLVDEASGVPNEIYTTAEGALTGDNYLFVMISNPTRLIGYFYDSHHSDKANWQRFNFSSEDSPVVNQRFVERIIEKYGLNSDEYRVRVQGEFPQEDAVDDHGYLPLLLDADLREIQDGGLTGPLRLGVDPAGEGKDSTDWVVRDNFKAKVLKSEKVSNSKSIAQKTVSFMEYLKIPAEEVFVDNFGEGANVAQELGLAGHRVNSVNVGKQVDKREEEYDVANGGKKFVNVRAKAYWSVRSWLRSGGELVSHSNWSDQISSNRYRTELSGRLKMMGKREMRKNGIQSPNTFDALMLTFVEGPIIKAEQDTSSLLEEEEESIFLYPDLNL